MTWMTEWTAPLWCPRGSQEEPFPHWHSCLSCPDGRWGYVVYDPFKGTVSSQHAPLRVVQQVVNVANSSAT